jgi:hypothetical protein
MQDTIWYKVQNNYFSKKFFFFYNIKTETQTTLNAKKKGKILQEKYEI